MAEVIVNKRKAQTILTQPNAILLYLILTYIQICQCQIINRVPHFIPQNGDMSQFKIAENTTVGTPVYQLKGVDPENGALRYSISGQYFSVDPSTGVVTLLKSPDREEQANIEVVISITDQPIGNTEPNTVSLRRVISVTDVNDNPPIFHNRPYNVNVSEATEVGSEIEVIPNIIITDPDDDINAEILVSCTTKEIGSDAQACSTFKIKTEKIGQNKFHARIFLQKSLDYESRSTYIINFQAEDSSEQPLRALASVTVSVWDVQDQPPVFVNGPYSATVKENTPVGANVLEIIARDGDSANPRPILLTIEGDDEEYFELQTDESTGSAILVTTDNPIDRESNIILQNGGVYTFTIKATELINEEIPADSTETQVTIIVLDEDDNIPVFNSKEFDISVPENIDNGSPIPGLSVYVQDNDIGQNSRYTLSIRNVYNSEGIFAISTTQGEGRTPISVKVIDTTKLDYDVDDEEKRYFSFDLVASNNGEELSSARVNLKLLDVNDNAPVFDMTSYKFAVPENSSIGYQVGEVEATDRDYGIFGDIKYSLTGFGSQIFETNEHNGGLYLSGPIDYEKQKSYSLTLLAEDGGGKMSTASIFVDILDINDNVPLFELTEYSRTVRETATSFEPQFVIRASDADGPGQGGGRIKYTIESDNSISNNGKVFDINQVTGELSIIDKVSSMDTPRGIYELVVRATDYGVPPLSNETRVFIRVGVPGNQRPTFKGNYHNYKYTTVTEEKLDSSEEFTFELNPMNYKAILKEDARPGDNVTQVIANDPDGLDDLLRYHIVSGSKDNFVINEKTGLITVSTDANLDKDLNPTKYEIIVAVVDSGVPVPETATTTVYVTIQDVNNKPPKFNDTKTETYISEKTSVGDIVTKLTAYDPDEDALLIYSFTDSIKAFSKAGVQLKTNSLYDYKTIFKINENTGEIIVNQSLDYSKASIVILTIKVIDKNAKLNVEKQYDLTEHTIYIQPFANKSPQFTNAGWTSSNPVIHQNVKEGEPIGSTIVVLHAEDPLSGKVITNYKVEESDTSLLEVDKFSGQIVLTKNLDYEQLSTPNFTLQVRATSDDGIRSSIAKVVIEVENVNDNGPVFEKQMYKVSVTESTKYPEQILTVKAIDADAILTDHDKLMGFSDIRYTLRGDNSELFHIDNITGVMQVAQNKTLDRERQSVVRLEVVASDRPNGGSDKQMSSVIILIDILDVDDNTPMFDKKVYTAVVPENVQVGMKIIKVIATDPDEGLGGEVKYELLDEGEVNGLFSIDHITGDIRTQKVLTGRGRTDPYGLLVGATDGGGHSSDASIQIYIGDVSANDGVPRFIRPTSEEILYVSENTTLGSSVYQVVASDPDDPSQPSGQLYYTIQQNNNDSKIFAIDSQTGLISTRQLLDREKKSRYTLVLEVWDRGQPPQHSARIVNVVVTDVDDHKPHFIRNLDDPPMILTVDEEVPINTTVGFITAVDEDIDENAAIDYIITDGNKHNLFSLERTDDNKGIIKVNSRIDREAVAKQLLTVKCFKYQTKPIINKAFNRLEPSEIQVLIIIADIDDHLPKFDSENITIGVKLNVPINTNIASIKAVDPDSDALPINYTIVNSTFESPFKRTISQNITDVINVSNSTGDLRILKNLIHYADGIFRLIIRASNSKKEDRYSEILVEVVVVREKDLLRLIWDNSASFVRNQIPNLKEQLDNTLAPIGLKMQIHDAAPLQTSDRSLDFSKTGACFLLRKTDTGEALSPNAMKKAIRVLGADFQNILDSSGVKNVSSCAITRARYSYTQHALLGLATLLPVAAFIAALILCAMHSRAKRKVNRALLLQREPPPMTSSNVSVPTRVYSEPLYSG